jgi:hypothetical protein
VQLLLVQRLEESSSSCFPAVEAWLQEDSDHQRAFHRIKGRKSAGRYRSMMDFLVSEVCPEERENCFRFYRDEGPRLIELHSERRIRFLESKLLVFLTLAYEAHCQERALSWGQAVSFVEELCAA